AVLVGLDRAALADAIGELLAGRGAAGGREADGERDGGGAEHARGVREPKRRPAVKNKGEAAEFPARALVRYKELLMLALLALAFAAEPAVDAHALAKKVQVYYEKTKDLEAKFTQSYTYAAYHRTQKSSGVIKVKKPGK